MDASRRPWGGAADPEIAAMVQELSIYRGTQGEQFYRTSPTSGRTGSFRVEADTVAALERWLRENGYRPVPFVRAA